VNNVPESDDLLRLKRTLAAFQKLQAKLQAVESAKTEPIAIIGMGCRFPGADNPESFWRLVREGVDAIGEVPASRWDSEAYYDPDPHAAGKIATRCGGFLENVDLFDAQFFGISPREAVSLDPQQRLLLEVSWEALEHSGIRPDRMAGSLTGVFVGISSSDFAQSFVAGDHGKIDHYMGSGNARSVAAGRLSYILGFKGPSLALDTACSSSLVAVHLACESLRRQECALALAGGVNLLFAPEVSISHSRAQMLAPDGRCKTFDASADGFVRAEGCGIVVLKRLTDALAEQDNVLAVILGSALNHDGRTSGLTVPSGPSQESVIRAALATAGVDPLQVSYVEAHGTGTRLGDPIEVGALAAVLCNGRSKSDPLIVGSVKTNIGHLESAAGIAGLMKAVLALNNRQIPPHLHFRQPNPLIPWEDLPIRIPLEREAWQSSGQRRITGVSSFGFSGTNAHIILSEPSAKSAPAHEEATIGFQAGESLLVISAKTETALRNLAGRYVEFLTANPSITPDDLAYSAAIGRSHFACRVSVTYNSTKSCCEKLNMFAAHQETAGLAHGHVLIGQHPRIAFLFTGQGSQYPGMASGLYQMNPGFRAAVDRCEGILKTWLDRRLTRILFNEPAEVLNRTAYTQPALFVLEYSLAELWRSWGIEPEFLLGHSVGEYAAACVAGVFSLEDGLMLIAARARLMDALVVPGEMVAVLADEARVTEAISPYAQDVSIAAINGPRNVVLSGPQVVMNEVTAGLAADGVQSVRLPVSHAFHSALMIPMLAEFRKVAISVKYSSPRIPIVSNLTGTLAGDDIASPEYWCRHVRESVRFAAGVKTLERAGCDAFVEIGPKPLLLDLARQSFTPAAGEWLPSLRPPRPDLQQILESLGTLYSKGAPVDWTRFYAPFQRRRVQLPLYPFDRQRYWPKPSGSDRPSQSLSLRTFGSDHSALHPLLGRRCWVAGSDETRFECRIAADSPAYLGDHTVFDTPIFPASGYLEMALAAGSRLFKTDKLVLENVCYRQALILDEPKLTQVVLSHENGNPATFRIYSGSPDREDAPATLHATGSIRPAEDRLSTQEANRFHSHADATEEVSLEELYSGFRRHGVHFGATFRAITKLMRGSRQVLAQLEAPAPLHRELSRYHFHPAILDACAQVSGVFSLILPDMSTLLQSGVERLHYYGPPGKKISVSARVRQVEGRSQESWLADFEIFDESGAICAVIEGQSARIVSRESIMRAQLPENPEQFYELQWVPKSRSASESCRHLASPAAIAECLRNEIAKVSAHPELKAYGTLLLMLDRLAAAYIPRAFGQMGWEFRVGEHFTCADMIQRLRIADRHLRLFERLLGILAENGILHLEKTVWSIIAIPSFEDPDAQVKRLSDQFPDARTELSLLKDCGTGLPAVLQGTLDPLRLLFTGGQVDRIGTLYEESVGAIRTREVLARTVASAVENLPAGQTLRVLEIGAGTGAMSASIIDALPKLQTQYTFTDISPRFLTYAQGRFYQYPFVEYRVLDIEQPPLGQGFEANRYDMVVATNVLHSTRDLRQTLTHVCELLTPGGTLIMLEGTAPSAWLDLVFGMLEGWWRFTDTELRRSHPLLPADVWKDLLSETGFYGAVAASADPGSSNALARQAVIVARKSDALATAGADAMGSWLILADKGGVGEELARLLTARNGACHIMIARDLGLSSGARSPHGAPASITEREAMDELEGAVARVLRTSTSLRGIVHLWSLDNSVVPEITPADLDRAAITGSVSLLHLVRTVIKLDVAKRPKLWIVTRDAQPAGRIPSVSGVADAPVWGLGKVLALEHREIWGGIIDLPSHRSANEAAVVFEEILDSDDEDQIAIRDGERFVPRLMLRHYTPNRNLTIHSDGTYLITGGLGALGLDVARWLATQGARHIALLGRSKTLSQAAKDTVQRLVEGGAEISILKGDVGDMAEMERVFESLRRSPVLRGVVHAAGVPAAGDFDSLTADNIRASFAAKVTGTWILHQLTRRMPLDFFVLCSSMVSVWGAKGQPDYVAANNFLDAFAHYRRALGLPVLSINWGPLTGGGMLPSDFVADLARMGVTTSPMDRAVRILGQLLRCDVIQTAVVNIDWRLFTAVYEARNKRPLFENIQAKTTKSLPARLDLAEQLRRTPAGEKQQTVREHVQHTLAAVLRLSPEHVPDPRMGFFDLGMDSLTAMEFRDRLESSLGISLPVSVALDYSTVETLTPYLLHAMSLTSQHSEQLAEQKGTSTSVEMLQDLSDEDVEQLLLKKLETL